MLRVREKAICRKQRSTGGELQEAAAVCLARNVMSCR